VREIWWEDFFHKDSGKYAKRGSGNGISLYRALQGKPGGRGAALLRTLTGISKKALEKEHLFFKGLRKGTLRHVCKEWLGRFVYWARKFMKFKLFLCAT
jgi:hypothetical protein